MFRSVPATPSAASTHFALPPLRRLGRPSPLPTLVAPRSTLWSRLLALLEPAAARERREWRARRAVVVPFRR